MHLERVAPPADGGLAVHVVKDGLYTPTAGASTVLPSVIVQGGDDSTTTAAAERRVAAVFTVRDLATGAVVGSARSTTQTVAAGTRANLTASFALSGAKLWSVQQPALYTVVAAIEDASSGAALDGVNATIGVRTIEWKVEDGFYLNGQNIKLRGFCHHDDFTGVGMAMPDRVWLFRAMQSRGAGSNAWRSKNPNLVLP